MTRKTTIYRPRGLPFTRTLIFAIVSYPHPLSRQLIQIPARDNAHVADLVTLGYSGPSAEYLIQLGIDLCGYFGLFLAWLGPPGKGYGLPSDRPSRFMHVAFGIVIITMSFFQLSALTKQEDKFQPLNTLHMIAETSVRRTKIMYAPSCCWPQNAIYIHDCYAAHSLSSLAHTLKSQPNKVDALDVAAKK
jgi:hypothetical protein